VQGDGAGRVRPADGARGDGHAAVAELAGAEAQGVTGGARRVRRGGGVGECKVVSSCARVVVGFVVLRWGG